MRLITSLLVGSFLISCSSLKSIDAGGSRRGEYENYLSEHLKVDRLYMKLREMAIGRALMITPESAALQAKVVPGFELLPVEGKTLFVVSLEMQDWSRFSISDFNFLLGEQKATSVKEIMDEQLLNTLYPFAVPHDRAFVVEFDSPVASTLKIQTSQGQFEFNYGEG
ncbi:MAG: hypothetical protein R3A80_11295 [Bdellovibrionota bacterium]